MKTLLIGLGNPILGDDGIGWRVIEYIQAHHKVPQDTAIDTLAVGGITLMEHCIGYDRVIIVDAIVTGAEPLGAVNCHQLDEMYKQESGHMSSPHDTTLQNALKVGALMGAQLPEEVVVVTVESLNVYDFSEKLSPPIEAAVSKAANVVMRLLTE